MNPNIDAPTRALIFDASQELQLGLLKLRMSTVTATHIRLALDNLRTAAQLLEAALPPKTKGETNHD